jgi:hypothetical protein
MMGIWKKWRNCKLQIAKRRMQIGKKNCAEMLEAGVPGRNSGL